MKVSKEYQKNLKGGIVTIPMLSDALYTYNKRAKNMRDKAREYRRTRYYTNYDYYGEYVAKKEDYYKRKEELLSYLKPDCIHIVEREDWEGDWFEEYFLFYDLGEHSFHTPIDNPKRYPDLKVENIGDLETFGKEIEELMSVQTADKIRNGLSNGTLTLVDNDGVVFYKNKKNIWMFRKNNIYYQHQKIENK